MNLPKFLASNLSILLSFSFINGGVIPEDPINLEYPDRVCQAVKDFKEGNLLGGYNCLLLYGPTGSGKSTLVRNIAEWTDSEILVVNCSELQTPYSGSASVKIREVISEAQRISNELGRKVVIVFEEVDRIACKVTSEGLQNNGQRVDAVTTLWHILDEYKNQVDSGTNIDFTTGRSKELLFLLTTNRKDDLDFGFSNRIGFTNKCELDYPSENNRKKIILHLVSRYQMLDFVDLELQGKIAKETEDFNFRDLANLFDSVFANKQDKNSFSFDDFKTTISLIKKESKENSNNNDNNTKKESLKDFAIKQGVGGVAFGVGQAVAVGVVTGTVYVAKKTIELIDKVNKFKRAK